ncbi:MAG: aromatic ring-hydroxylating dioxygenase subunit alpha [Acidimicrobiaceae bacterium]|nr:aromatic ring-hydroxylating dioxygenase subunit alpha [Acidimicrobiaceae bacterium]MCY4174855.1 aromatic ring-hydroxylating dioxygenase subunit alpha [Acidimicrobiaceae bacterium]MCY4281014.1 aromatic ring-hydroxylating dioxygenase subunit alpha [Acidimicrobiaceae bacterium]MCY4294864.1 aromatic ring-hydroxylating dioxygenase subunit alpha [Acidimicrobiaceae bacterium]
MSKDVSTQNASAPPSLDEATNLRQQVRASGMDPNYWYAVEEARNVKPGQVVEVVFWKQPIALYRSEDGAFHALDNRCAHRQVKLSIGQVSGCDLVCEYHGWRYDSSGRLVHMPDTFARSEPLRVSIRSYPVQVRYGLVWLFPGDPELASERELPEIPEITNPEDGEKPWGTVRVAFTCAAHHSMIIDNVSDLSHAFLHRRYRPFDRADLTHLETRGDNVHMTYESHVGRGRISSRFVDHKRLDTDHIELCYEYPYQWSNTSDEIKHWLFVLPIDEQTTRMFFIFYFKSFKVPALPIRLPRPVMRAVLKIADRTMITPLLRQDRVAVEAEQEGYNRHWSQRPLEVNPAVREMQQVTVRKWQGHLDREAAKNGTSTETRVSLNGNSTDNGAASAPTSNESAAEPAALADQSAAS